MMKMGIYRDIMGFFFYIFFDLRFDEVFVFLFWYKAAWIESD